MVFAEKHSPSWPVNHELELDDLHSVTKVVHSPPAPAPPSLAGIPLKYISLVTLAVQNSALAVLMHYSRISAQPNRAYSPASAVLATELFKGAISLAIAFSRVELPATYHAAESRDRLARSSLHPRVFIARCRSLGKDVFRSDCWKLSIPAILYVIQNNLQFVAVSNLDAATFQVSYQMKILTTAAFSVLLLRKRLTPLKWLALFFLALGVATVQLQATGTPRSGSEGHIMVPLKGFLAVAAACFTSGLAGVYFEMVLKNSSGDLWVRNVQLSLFSLLPALAPIFLTDHRSASVINHDASILSFTRLFANFTPAAWATVATQVLGGLLTALVIKYADNIMKGFATSLSIVLSFLLSVALFNVRITLAFIIGATIVLAATWLYSQPDTRQHIRKPREIRILPMSNPVSPIHSATLAPAVTVNDTSPVDTTMPSHPISHGHHHHHSLHHHVLGRRTPGGSPHSSPTSPSPPEVLFCAQTGAPMRSHSMSSILSGSISNHGAGLGAGMGVGLGSGVSSKSGSNMPSPCPSPRVPEHSVSIGGILSADTQ